MVAESHHLEPSQDSASLVKRLAGPSTTKAGLALDQTEINRIIAEASKGSKFYENEKKKDRDLTERISRILKKRDEALKGVDIQKIEHAVDNILVDLESMRDLSQIIVHVDMDAFYANVELLDNPQLLGKPFGVGGGVLTTASYEARRYGVRSGMPGFIAKKLCPHLILVDMHFPRYSEMSRIVMDIFRRYDSNMETTGCDEGFLNVTAYCQEHGLSADDCVREMRDKVREETQLTVSAGIAPNKMLAKICSDKNKPNGQFHLPFERVAIVTFMHDLSIRKIPGVGRVNERLLDSIGIKTCGDIFTYRATISLMDKYFGLKFLLRTHLGIASNTVRPGQREERKSIGAERTFNPLGDREKILQKLEEVAAELEKDMKQNAWTGRTVTLKYKLDTYQVFTRAKSFDRWITAREDLFTTGKELLLPELPLKIRLIGLRVTKLKDLRSSSNEGIKRFFEPLNLSPNKNQKLSHNTEYIDLTSDPDIFTVLSLDEHDHDEEAMPGFHEHDETDEETLAGEQQQDQDEERKSNVADREPDNSVIWNSDSKPRPRPPVSAPSLSQSKPPTPLAHFKPRSTGNTARTPHSSLRPGQRAAEFGDGTHTELLAPTSALQQCPICSKTIETDNQGLNTHVDFCLSRGAIREAQVQASSLHQSKGRLTRKRPEEDSESKLKGKRRKT